VGEDGIRRRRDGLERIEVGITARAIGAYIHFQPVIAAVKNALAEINRDGEKSIGQRNAVGEHGATRLRVPKWVHEQPEPEVVKAAGRPTIVLKPALVG